MTKYRYKLIPQYASSDKYGKCEICGKFVSDVYSQTKEHEYVSWDGSKQWSHCPGAFGHKACLIGIRR